MPEFIIDANLPAKIKVWENSRFIYVSSIDASWNDDEIWKYAKENNLSIITKGKDFLIYQFANGFPPKIIHIKFGNLKLKEFVAIIQNCWHEAENLLKTHPLINIYSDKIEAIK